MTRITREQFVDLICMAEKVLVDPNVSRPAIGKNQNGFKSFDHVEYVEYNGEWNDELHFYENGLEDDAERLPLDSYDTYFQDEERNAVIMAWKDKHFKYVLQ